MVRPRGSGIRARAFFAALANDQPKAKRAVSVKATKKVPSWIGSGKGNATIKPGVDLTKPTLPPGKHL